MSAIPNLTCPICDNSEDDLLDPNKYVLYEYIYYAHKDVEPDITTPFHKIMAYDCTKCLYKMLNHRNFEIPEFKKCGCYKLTAIELGVSRGSIECLKILFPYIKILDIIDHPIYKKCNLITIAIKQDVPKTLGLLLDCVVNCLSKDLNIEHSDNFVVFWNEILELAINRSCTCLKIILKYYAENKEIQQAAGRNFKLSLHSHNLRYFINNMMLYIKKTSYFKDYNTTWTMDGNILNSESLSDIRNYRYIRSEYRIFLLQNLNLSITKPAIKVQKVRS